MGSGRAQASPSVHIQWNSGTTYGIPLVPKPTPPVHSERPFFACTRDQRAKAALRARATCSSLVRFLARASPPRLPKATARGSFLRFSLDTILFPAILVGYYPPSMTVNLTHDWARKGGCPSKTHVLSALHSRLTICYPLSIIRMTNIGLGRSPWYRHEGVPSVVEIPEQHLCVITPPVVCSSCRIQKHGMPILEAAT